MLLLPGRCYYGLNLNPAVVFILRSAARWESTSHHHDLPQWPKTINPSPYEVFATTRQQFDKKHLKATYFRLIKAYHPDSALILNPDVNLKERTRRFRKIKEAYDILKDDSKRREYDLRVGSSGMGPPSGQRYGGPDRGPYTHFRPAYTRPGYRTNQSTHSSAHFDPKQYAEEFYTGNPFGDYTSDEKFEEQLRKNRKTLTRIVAGTVLVIAVIELKAIFAASDWAIQRAEHASFLSKMDELHAKSNYGMGLFPEDRVSRFLAVRNSSGLIDNYQTDKLKAKLEAERQSNSINEANERNSPTLVIGEDGRIMGPEFARSRKDQQHLEIEDESSHGSAVNPV